MKRNPCFPLFLSLFLLICFHITSCSLFEQSSLSPHIQESEISSIIETGSYAEHSPPKKQTFTSITLSQKDHPELDFGIWEQDGGYTIRDFSFTPDETLLLLQISGVVSEYDFSGNLIGIYYYKLSDQGLSAFRICARDHETYYLLDGNNNSILTCNREKVTNSSYVDWNDLGLSGNYFECDQDGRPCLSAVHPTINVQGNVSASFTYALNVDDERVAIEETSTGRGIAGGFSFQIRKHDETLGTSEIYFDIYRYGILDCTISVSSAFPENKSIVGADLIGIIKDQYLIKIIEVIYPSNSSRYYISSTYLLVDNVSGTFQSCECTIPDNSIIRYIESETFYLTRTEESIHIISIEESCRNFHNTDHFIVSVSN